MKVIAAVGAVLALMAGVLLLRTVLHYYTDHGHLDVLHLTVGITAAVAGVFLGRRALLHRG